MTLFRGALIGGLIVFLWGFFSWMVLPWHAQSMRSFENECSVTKAIHENVSEDGLYVLPNIYSYPKGISEADKQHQMKMGKAKMKTGPYVVAAVKMGGTDPDSIAPYVRGLIIQIIGALIVTWMLMKTKGLIYPQKVLFVALFGFSIGLLGMLPRWNWAAYPLDSTVFFMIDMVIAWGLAGLALGKIVKK